MSSHSASLSVVLLLSFNLLTYFMTSLEHADDARKGCMCTQVFSSLNLTAYDLSVDMLDVHAVSIINTMSLKHPFTFKKNSVENRLI